MRLGYHNPFSIGYRNPFSFLPIMNEHEIHYEACVNKAQDNYEAALRSGDESRITKAANELEYARNAPGKPSLS